jgi:hypothetical protein
MKKGKIETGKKVKRIRPEEKKEKEEENKNEKERRG